MKYRLSKIFGYVLVALFVFVPMVFAGTLGAGPVDSTGKVLLGWNNMGGGWWHNGSYYSNSDGSIQAYTSNEFGALMNPAPVLTTVVTDYSTLPSNLCTPGTLNTITNQCSAVINNVPTNIGFCSSTNNTGPCAPERVDSVAANNLAQNAQKIAIGRGYTATCSADKVGFPGIDPNTALNFYYSVACTLNGLTGVGASYIVNGTSYWWSELDKTIAAGKVPTTPVPPVTPTPTNPLPVVNTTNISGLPTPTISQAQLAQIGANLKNQSISYIRELMQTYTRQLEETKSQLQQSFVANTNTSAQSNPIASTPALSCVGSLNSDLKLGSTGADVGILTDYLVSKGFLTTKVNVFTQSVFDSVVTFQQAHNSEILTPAGLTVGTGFVGPRTRAYINTDLCSQTEGSVGGVTFTSNVSGVMYAGDLWNIVITGLNPNETIYATGGKKVNGVVPQDKTPYTADSLGIYSKISTHAADVVGDWQLVWTRADGSNLATLTFSVKPFALPFITSVNSTSIKAGAPFQILGSNFNQSNTIAELINSQGASVTLPAVGMTNDAMSVIVPAGLTTGVYTLQIRFVGIGVNFGKISNAVSMNVTI